MKINDTVYYVQRSWRRVVPGSVLNSDDVNVVMLVSDRTTWIVPRCDTYVTDHEAYKVLNEFIDKYGPLPVEGETCR